MKKRMPAAVAAAWALCLALPACGGSGHGAGPGGTPSPGPSATPSPSSDRVIVAVGDIVCGSDTAPGTPCRHRDTAALVAQIRPDAVLGLGDMQYEYGGMADFMRYYDPTWGVFRDKTLPVPGNHEYRTAQAHGYYDYFNGLSAFSGPAGDRDKGYYSFDIGQWHVVALNSICGPVGGCGDGSPQMAFLRLDLEHNRRPCTLAYWHHPRFSSGENGGEAQMGDVWRTLYEHRVDVVLNGHDHDYERFGLQTPEGVPDPTGGIGQFVVGTGGRDVRPFRAAVERNSEVRERSTFGVLRMKLRPGSYEWQFVPIAGQAFTDAGSESCR
jgi:hypothetical protein